MGKWWGKINERYSCCAAKWNVDCSAHSWCDHATHTVCDRSADRRCCPSDRFSINRTTQAYSPVIGPKAALVQPVFPWWQEATCWVLVEVSSEPMNLVAVPSAGISHWNPRACHHHRCSILHTFSDLISRFKTVFPLLPLCSQSRATVQ